MMKRGTLNIRKNVFTSVIIGLVIMLLVSILACLGMSCLVVKGTVDEKGILWICAVVHALAAFAGSAISGKRIAQKYVFVCVGVSMSYYLLLIGSTALFFDGTFERAGWQILPCVAGGIAACLLCSLKGKKRVIKRAF